MRPTNPWRRFRLIAAAALFAALPAARAGAAEGAAGPAGPKSVPGATDWISLGNRLEAAYEQAKATDSKAASGIVWAPQVAVDRTDGRLFAFPHGGSLWVSRDRGQTFEWLNHDVANWGFNESPTSLYVSPDGGKLRIFSSDRSGFSLDDGRTWQYLNFSIQFGFEDGHVNWNRDARMVVARSHTWPKPRMWLSRDAGANFSEYPPDITEQINSQSMALLDDDVLVFQGPKLVRSTDYGQTLTAVPSPEYVNPDGKQLPTQFLGVSVRLQDQVYWLNSCGVFTSADKGQTWTLVGRHFPPEWIAKRLVRSGPLFGKDARQMLVLCLDHVAETLDGGQSWHVLAELPTRLTDHPWAHSFAYDPQGDVLYANNREHSGGPYLFGRLALRRWGDVENVAPSAPTDLETEILPSGNAALVRWKPSQDASGIAWYRVYVGGQLYGYTERPEIKLSDFAWNERLKLTVQAVDAWQNLSPQVEHTVQFAGQPAGTVLLADLASSTAAFDGAPMERLVERYTAIDKSSQPVSYLVDGYEPNPVPRFLRKPAAYGFGIRVRPDFKPGVLEYPLDGKYSRLLLDAGMSDSGWDRVQITLLLDGKVIAAPQPYSYETRIRHIGRKAESFDVDVSNAKTLRIEIKVADPRYWQEDVVVFGNGLLFARR